MAKLIDIEGIGRAFALRLEALGLRTTAALLKRAAHLRGRRELAAQLGVSERRLLAWVNRADLMRVPRIGTQFSDLLEASGVDTVKELRNRIPANLHAKLLEVNAVKKLARRDPTLIEVTAWVAAARKLAPLVTHSVKGQRMLEHQARVKKTLAAKTDNPASGL
jgi:NAD(P)-dependent dehydrogenase (short-subunit alcohol dehydrogenase family)